MTVIGEDALIHKAGTVAAHKDDVIGQKAGGPGFGSGGGQGVAHGDAGFRIDEIHVRAGQCAQVPEIGAHFDSHLNAVTGIVPGAFGVPIGWIVTLGGWIMQVLSAKGVTDTSQ